MAAGLSSAPSSSPPSRARRISLALLLCGVFLVFGCLLLPQIPQVRLADWLKRRFVRQFVSPPVFSKAYLVLLPRPGLLLSDFKIVCPDYTLAVSQFRLDLSFAGLLRGKIVFRRCTLRKGEVVFVHGIEPLLPMFEKCPSTQLPLAELSSVVWNDVRFIMAKTAVSKGFPLRFGLVRGDWHRSRRFGTEVLNLAGTLNGGRLSCRVTWYQKSGRKMAAGEDEGVEVTLHLKGAAFNAHLLSHFGSGTGFLASSPEKRVAVKTKKEQKEGAVSVLGYGITARGVDADLNLNGDPAVGLRLTLVLDLSGFKFIRPGGVALPLFVPGRLRVRGTGFLQPHSGYFNLRSAALSLPGTATLFSRGLVRFHDSLLVDLVNHLQVEKLGRLLRMFPDLKSLPVQLRGALSGECKLAGDPCCSPSIIVSLGADRIESFSRSSQPRLERSQVLLPEKEEAEAVAVPSGSSGRFFWVRRFVERLAAWNGLLKGKVRIGELCWEGQVFKNFELDAEKKHFQFVIERLAADFPAGGKGRLTLVLSELLDDEPRWQASLITRKFPVSLVSPSLLPDLPGGRLDLSLVASGRLPVAATSVAAGAALNLEGRFSLEQGRIAPALPLWAAFKTFLTARGRAVWLPEFSARGKFTLHRQVMRLNGIELLFSGGRNLRLQGRVNLPDHLQIEALCQDQGAQFSLQVGGTPAAPELVEK